MRTCRDAKFDPAFAAAWWQCFNSSPCGNASVINEACAAQEREPYLDDPTARQRYDECQARHDECCPAGPCAFDVRNCDPFLVLNDTAYPEYAACLALACDQIPDCFVDIREQPCTPR